MVAERVRRGWTQTDVAEKLRVSKTSIYKWETGESVPMSDNLMDLAKLYNVSVEYLMVDTDAVAQA